MPPWFYELLSMSEQTKFQRLLATLGKGGGLRGLAGDLPPDWEPGNMPPDRLDDPPKNFEWLPRTAILLGTSASRGHTATGDLLIPVEGATKVVVDYCIYQVADIGGTVPVLYIDTSYNPSVPRGWGQMDSSTLSIGSTSGNTAGRFEFTSSDTDKPEGFIRWRLNNADASAEPLVELGLKVTVIKQ
jgi:hypothetical protein